MESGYVRRLRTSGQCWPKIIIFGTAFLRLHCFFLGGKHAKTYVPVCCIQQSCWKSSVKYSCLLQWELPITKSILWQYKYQGIQQFWFGVDEVPVRSFFSFFPCELSRPWHYPQSKANSFHLLEARTQQRNMTSSSFQTFPPEYTCWPRQHFSYCSGTSGIDYWNTSTLCKLNVLHCYINEDASGIF